MKNIAILAIAASTVALPTAAFAQDSGAEVTIGASAGIHNLGVADEIEDLTNLPADDSAGIFGGFIAVDFPVSESIFAGIEGNANIGTGALDADYGASVRLGYRGTDGTKVYVRGGYQFIDLDLANILDVPENAVPAGLDTTVDDYLVGAGVEFPIGSFILRGNVDTISFDTLRATAGVGFRF